MIRDFLIAAHLISGTPHPVQTPAVHEARPIEQPAPQVGDRLTLGAPEASGRKGLFGLLHAHKATAPSVPTPAPSTAEAIREADRNARTVGQNPMVAAAIQLTPSAEPRAILPSGQAVPPTTYRGGYHGTTDVPPEVALRDGLPGRGDNWDLLNHVTAGGNSAFRGTTAVIYDPVMGGGAAAWADEGGWVYDIQGVPTWDVNRLLEGRVQKADGRFGGNLMYGEQENAIPARVPAERIKRYGQVVSDSMGRLRVAQWVDNPGFKGG